MGLNLKRKIVHCSLTHQNAYYACSTRNVEICIFSRRVTRSKKISKPSHYTGGSNRMKLNKVRSRSYESDNKLH
ncbi:hypothetical protein T02_15092 [Trichinella nativa]|uniref:Uncharacterized protein n=1 Tax=Trichinella nativa TaxID=6335 RepID=A0A0V1LM21_9BILA|nr:hypothetical protein T02_15092 [Trichinella nativa]